MNKPASVTEALSAVMADLPAIGKDQTAAAQQGGYAYRGIEDITRKVQPLLAKHGVVLAPHVLSQEVVDLVVNGKPWTDTRLLVSYTAYGPGGREDCIDVGPILAIGRDNADKGANKCMTQAFKYLLLQLLCVSDAKDDGDAASVEADHRQPPAAQKTTTRRPPLRPQPEAVPKGQAKNELLAALGGDMGQFRTMWEQAGGEFNGDTVSRAALDRLLAKAKAATELDGAT